MVASRSETAGRNASQLVVVGASAGGIEALLTLVSTLAGDFPAPIVVAQHLDPRRPSHLANILAARSTLPVRTVTSDEPLMAGVVYVVPSDRDVVITDHHVGLRDEESVAPKPSVDRLLGSAARTFGEDLIAVILTGTGADGAAGALTVKMMGGTVIVQNPETASFPGMPLAVPPSAVDIVVDLEAIGPLLADLLSGTYVVPETGEDEVLPAFLDRVREQTGLDFGAYKRPTIARRLQRRMAAVGTATLTDYRAYAERHPEEMQRLVASFLIKVTQFFRDPDLFTYLRDRVLPPLVDEARERGELRLWSAGCATGEEAYTLAMLVADILGEEIASLPVRIFATDVATEAVDFARRGIYSAAALDGLAPDLIERHFLHVDGAYEVHKSVRGLVVFGEHDLGRRAPFPRIDLVLCRNVLIYFTPELQRRALQLFAFSLRRGGYLALGKAETVNPFPEFFSLEQSRLKLFRRVGEPVPIPAERLLDVAPPPPRVMRASRRTTARRLVMPLPPHAASEPSPSLEAVLLLDGLPVGVITVDVNYHIRTINLAARRLLGIHSEAIGEDLIHRVTPAIGIPLRVALDATFRGETTSLVHQVTDDVLDDDGRDLAVTCYPLDRDETEEGVAVAVIVVGDVTRLAQSERELEGERQRLRDELARQDERAERAVAEGRELRVANQGMAAVSARLRAENDELLVVNEEAQAAAEEIETLNEELQATNEELETLNEELQATVEELTTTNDELQARGAELRGLSNSRDAERGPLAAALAAIEDAVLVLDQQGRAILTNAAYQRLFGAEIAFLPTGEEGGPLPPEATPQARVARGEAFSITFTRNGADGSPRLYEANSQPFDHDGDTGGGMITIRDITDRPGAPGGDQSSAG